MSVGVVEFVGVNHLVTIAAVELCREGEFSVGERGVETIGKIGVWVTQDDTVFSVDGAVFVGVDISNVACPQLITVIYQFASFLITLENAVGLVSPEQSDGFTLDEDVDGECCRGIVRQVGSVVGLIDFCTVFCLGQAEVGDLVVIV